MTTTNKGLIQPANGSYVDTWDQPVNNDWSYIDTAFGGSVSLNATGISTYTLTLTEYRPLSLSISGAISNNVTYSIPSGVGGQWVIFNGTTDATGGPWNIIFTCVGSAVTVTIPRGTTTNVVCDGTNLLFADGRPGSPGGSNTQVQYNNNGTLGGSSNFVFDGTNVGIGTTTLNFKLTAANNAFDGAWMGSSGTYSFVGLGGYFSSSAGSAQIGFERSTGAFVFGNGTRDIPTERMRIAATGNVGIGSTIPPEKLSIAGNISMPGGSIYGNSTGVTTASLAVCASSAFSGGGGSAMVVRGYTAGYNNGGIEFYYGNGSNTVEAMRIDSSGNVGIGTTSPSQKLQVQTTGDAVAAITSGNGYSSYLFLGKAATTNAAYITYDNGNNMIFQVNASERMRIDSSGNVGIGTTLPSSQLSVANNISAGLGLFFGSNANYWYQASSTQGTLRVGAFGSYSYFNFISSASGPQLAGSTLTFSGNSGANEHMRIASNGFVGIGTTSPGNSLVVAGTIQSTSGGFEFPDNTVQTTAATTTPPCNWNGRPIYLCAAAIFWRGNCCWNQRNLQWVQSNVCGRSRCRFSIHSGWSNMASNGVRKCPHFVSTYHLIKGPSLTEQTGASCV